MLQRSKQFKERQKEYEILFLRMCKNSLKLRPEEDCIKML